MISRSTIAAAARVIEYAAARPIVLSTGLMPPSEGVAQVAAALEPARCEGDQLVHDHAVGIAVKGSQWREQDRRLSIGAHRQVELTTAIERAHSR